MQRLLFLVLALVTGPSLVTLSAPGVSAVMGEGGEVDATIDITVADGYHVQANPASDEYLIPTTLELTGAGGIDVKKIIYPKAKSFRLHGSDKDFAVYDGHFQIVARLGSANAKAAGHYELKGTLGYQACDARSCRPPTKAPVSVGVDVRLSTKARKG